MALSEEDKFSRQKTARGVPKSTTSSIVQIGTRDAQTGLYTILNPCGGEEVRVGEKIYSSVSKRTDVVRATRAGGSGLLQLDSINARSPVQERSILGDNCPGYFNGQIFSCDEESQRKRRDSGLWTCSNILNVDGTIFTFDRPGGVLSFQREAVRPKISTNWTANFSYHLTDLSLDRNSWEFSWTSSVDGSTPIGTISIQLSFSGSLPSLRIESGIEPNLGNAFELASDDFLSPGWVPVRIQKNPNTLLVTIGGVSYPAIPFDISPAPSVVKLDQFIISSSTDNDPIKRIEIRNLVFAGNNQDISTCATS